jgi:hypothetical protein
MLFLHKRTTQGELAGIAFSSLKDLKFITKCVKFTLVHFITIFRRNSSKLLEFGLPPETTSSFSSLVFTLYSKSFVLYYIFVCVIIFKCLKGGPSGSQTFYITMLYYAICLARKRIICIIL